MTDNCPWCWAELGPDDEFCPECKQRARRAAPSTAGAPTAPGSPGGAQDPPALSPEAEAELNRRYRPVPERFGVPASRTPLPPAKRGELIVTNPEKAPWWQRLLVAAYKVFRFLGKAGGELAGDLGRPPGPSL
jgi:hypothetical protein